MLFIKNAADSFMFATGDTDEQPLIIDFKKPRDTFGIPFFEVKQLADWIAECKNTTPLSIEANAEAAALYQEFEQGMESYNQFQQDMSDLDWQMERAHHMMGRNNM